MRCRDFAAGQRLVLGKRIQAVEGYHHVWCQCGCSETQHRQHSTIHRSVCIAILWSQLYRLPPPLCVSSAVLDRKDAFLVTLKGFNATVVSVMGAAAASTNAGAPAAAGGPAPTLAAGQLPAGFDAGLQAALVNLQQVNSELQGLMARLQSRPHLMLMPAAAGAVAGTGATTGVVSVTGAAAAGPVDAAGQGDVKVMDAVHAGAGFVEAAGKLPAPVAKVAAGEQLVVQAEKQAAALLERTLRAEPTGDASGDVSFSPHIEKLVGNCLVLVFTLLAASKANGGSVANAALEEAVGKLKPAHASNESLHQAVVECVEGFREVLRA